MKKEITILNTVVTTYGVGGDVPNSSLPSFRRHRVNIVSGDVDVSYRETATGALIALELGKLPAVQNIYDLLDVAQFSFEANANSVVVITSE